MTSLTIQIVSAIVILVIVFLYLEKRKEFNILKNSLDERQKDFSDKLSLLEMHYTALSKAKDEQIEKGEK